MKKVVDTLHLAAETHHTAYKLVEGEDPDWAIWYANWLLTLSELPTLLKNLPNQSELIYDLVMLDKQYTQKSPDISWEEYYAQYLLKNYS